MLFSAPHACLHLRDGAVKMGEEYTAAIAQWLAVETANHAIFTTRQAAEDPNWLPAGQYKNQIRQLVEQHAIELVVDIHGMTNRHHMGIAIGTMNGRSTGQCDVITPFLQNGFQLTEASRLPEPLTFTAKKPLPPGAGAEGAWQVLVVDHPRFTGGVRNHTVTRFATEQLGVAAVQIEIASVNRIVNRPASADWPHNYHGNPQAIAATVNALVEMAGMV